VQYYANYRKLGQNEIYLIHLKLAFFKLVKLKFSLHTVCISEWLLSWHTQITDYTDVNKTSNDVNKNMEHRLRILYLPVVNQHI
jgi:hypothetical protein